MSRLSGLLKRQFPAHRQRIGSIRKWVERSEVMCITKPQGSWIVSLLPGAGSASQRKHEDNGPRETVFFGVEDWIYFRPDSNDLGNMEVLRRARRQLHGVVSRKLRRGDTPAAGSDVRFLNAVRRFVVEASRAELRKKMNQKPPQQDHHHSRNSQPHSHGYRRQRV